MKKYLYFILGSAMLLSSNFWNKNKFSFNGSQEFISAFPAYNLNSKEISFFTDNACHVYIKLQTNIKDFVFMVDTGANTNVYWGDPFWGADYNIKLNEDITLIDNISEKRITMKYVEKLKITGGEDYPGDGILGQPFLRQCKNVIFDYKKNKIIFDGRKISNRETSFFYENCNCEDCSCNNCKCVPFPIIYMYAKYMGKEEKFLIDTGAAFFIVRDDFPESKWQEYKKNRQAFYTDISINNLKFKNIYSCYANSNNLYTNDEARAYSKKTNILGSPFFVNHIIQIDYENMKFRIK